MFFVDETSTRSKIHVKKVCTVVEETSFLEDLEEESTTAGEGQVRGGYIPNQTMFLVGENIRSGSYV